MDKTVNTRDRTWLLKEKYHGDPTPEFERDLDRLAQGEPLAYVIGWVPFLDCHIDLSLRPLIPRTETEFWVERAINEMPTDRPIRTLDLCAGSGCIGIAVAHHRPLAEAVFGEIDPSLLSEIATNLEINHIPRQRAQIIESDLFGSIDGVFDAILANPPYIDGEHPLRAEESVRHFEPHRALFSDSGGLGHISNILREAPRRLGTSGTLWCEFGSGQADDVLTLARASGLEATILNDQFGVPRILRATRNGHLR
jgi:release factor glutamine methyltransferase